MTTAETGTDLRLPSHVLAWAARAAMVPEGDLPDLSAAVRDLPHLSGSGGAQVLERWLTRAVLLPVAPRFGELRAWLERVVTALAAERGLERLGWPDREPMVATLREAATQVAPVLRASPEVALLAPALLSEIAPEGLMPLPEALESAGDVSGILRWWIGEGVARGPDAALRDAVRRTDRWRTPYLSWLRSMVDEPVVVAPLVHPRWQLAPVEVASFPLPHVAPGARVTVIADRGGAVVHSPAGRQVVRADRGGEFVWLGPDELAGAIAIQVRFTAPDEAGELRECAMSVLQAPGAGPEAMQAASAALRSELVVEHLRMAAAEVATGAEVPETREEIIATTVTLRAWLETAAAARPEPEVMADLVAIDALLEPWAEGLLALDEDAYAEAADAGHTDDSAWWGLPRRLESESLPPLGGVTDAGDPRAVIGRPGTPAYAAASGAPGCVKVPLVVIPDGERPAGQLATLCVGAGTPLPGTFLPLASEALRHGFRAAAAAMPGRAGRAPYHAHRVALQPSGLVVDGPSLGGAALAAFASCWLEAPPRADTTVAVSLALEGAVLVPMGVGGWDEKLEALVKGGIRRVVVAERDTACPRAGGFEWVDVSTVRDLLSAVGLDAATAGFEVEPPALADRLRALQEAIGCVAVQALDAYVGTELSPWIALGDHLWGLSEDLLESPVASHREAACDGFAHAAIAYLHAGALDDARNATRLLEGRSVPDEVALLRDIVVLEQHIDGAPLGDPEDHARRLESALGRARPEVLRDLGGYVLGTIGRWHLHARRWEDALEPLERAVAHHEIHLPHEAPRSRVYLANALRRGGRAEASVNVLERALDGARDWVRPYSPSYAASTETYARYELARTLLDLDRLARAERMAAEALASARIFGWWPSLGIVRTRAQILWRAGRVDEAERVAAQAQELAADAPASHQAFARRLAEEATGTATPEDDVY